MIASEISPADVRSNETRCYRCGRQIGRQEEALIVIEGPDYPLREDFYPNSAFGVLDENGTPGLTMFFFCADCDPKLVRFGEEIVIGDYSNLKEPVN
jgi:hypothetical protein